LVIKGLMGMHDFNNSELFARTFLILPSVVPYLITPDDYSKIHFQNYNNIN
jgi:hypothetical protein